MKLPGFFSLCLLAAGFATATAQEYYDITANYLQNALFDERFDYDASATGNVSQEIKAVDGWTAAHTADYTIVGIYQIGTKKTFNGASVPAKNVDGTTQGGVLALSTGWSESLILNQAVSLPAGKYKLVSAYYNGDGSKTAGTSLLAWIPTTGTATKSKVTSFQLGQWVVDTLSFVLTSNKAGKIQIGFKAAANGSGNSAKISVDYVKLLRDTPYGDTDLTAYKSKLNSLIASANAQYGETKRGAAALKAAIEKAQAVNESTTVTFAQIDEAYDQLNEAVTLFKALQTADTKLKALLTTAGNTAAKAAEGEAEELKSAIAEAQAVYDHAEATAEQLAEATAVLQAALDSYNFAHPTGNVPTVKTDPRFARGATMAFGRLTTTSNGASIKERGFCWSENPDPTIFDNRSSKTLTGSSSSGVSGTIYWLQNLKPATKYYMRAYAITAGYQVAYGEAIKFYTIPKGTITLQMRDGGDQTTYDRIKKASEDAVGYWNNLTEMKGFSPSVGFVDGTPTADCSYGGWIRVGSNTSYQRTGTILHEMLHGIGVIPWADTEWSRHTLRSGVNGDGYGTGNWLGDRVTEVVRFLQNSTTAQLNGDYQHMWPFGINGASEDTGEQVLYIANGLVCQALGEDGLQHTYSLYNEPYYAFDQEDDVKYYIKNESEDRGLNTSYLVPNVSGQLKWHDMTAAEAAQNDSVAWYITFTPENQYYQFRNAATGQYLTYTSGIKTAEKTTLTGNEDWNLMRGRVDVDGMRGYWIIHPESNWTPHCLQANTNGNTASATFNIANSAEAQRWLIMTLDEMQNRESKAIAQMKTLAEESLAQLSAMLSVPHIEEVEGTDEALATALAGFTERVNSATSTTELSAIRSEALQAALTFLSGVSATNPEQAFDLTYMLTNPTLDSGSDGWSTAATINYGCAEFFQKTFDFNQTVKQLPAGSYKFCVQGFQRPGSTTDAYKDFKAGNNKVTALLYAGTQTAKLAHICDTMLTRKLGKGNEAAATSSRYVPNDMQAASAYFAKGFYQNAVIGTVASEGGSLKVGIKAASMPTGYWTIFDNFQLLFYGKSIPMGINTLNAQPSMLNSEFVYDLQGRRMTNAQRSTLNAQLKKGVYVKNGRKIVVK